MANISNFLRILGYEVLDLITVLVDLGLIFNFCDIIDTRLVTGLLPNIFLSPSTIGAWIILAE